MFERLMTALKTWRAQQGCDHKYRYSRSKPGTLVCKHCRKRRRPDAQVFR